jgi:hypothetical protein
MARWAGMLLWCASCELSKTGPAVLAELSLYPACESFAGPARPRVVNATAAYLEDIERFCTSRDASVAGHIVVTPLSAIRDTLLSRGSDIICTLGTIHMNMESSGVAAWVSFSDAYNLSAGLFYSLGPGIHSPHSREGSMPFFDAGDALDPELLRSLRSGKDSAGEKILVQLALRTRHGHPPFAALLEAPWCRFLTHWLPGMVYLLGALLAAYFFWVRYREEGMKLPAMVLALEAACCPMMAVTQVWLPDVALYGLASGSFGEALMMVMGWILPACLAVLLSFNIALYLAVARTKALPDYEVPRSRSDRAFSSEDLLQHCPKANALFVSIFIVLCSPLMPPIAGGPILCAALLLCGNGLCFYHACRLWSIRDEMEKDTRRSLTRMVQWSWLTVLCCFIQVFAVYLLTLDSKSAFKAHYSIPADVRYVFFWCMIFYSNACLHLGQVCVWGWPYERDLEREVRDLTRVVKLFVHAGAFVSPDLLLEGVDGFEETFGQRAVPLRQLCSSALDMDVARVAIQTVIRTGRAQKVKLQLVSQERQEWMRCTVGAICVNGRVYLSFIVEARGYVLLDG